MRPRRGTSIESLFVASQGVDKRGGPNAKSLMYVLQTWPLPTAPPRIACFRAPASEIRAEIRRVVQGLLHGQRRFRGRLPFVARHAASDAPLLLEERLVDIGEQWEGIVVRPRLQGSISAVRAPDLMALRHFARAVMGPVGQARTCANRLLAPPALPRSLALIREGWCLLTNETLRLVGGLNDCSDTQ